MPVGDYPDWATPQAHATAISDTGVPLLRAGNSIKFNIGTVIAGAGSSTLLSAGSFTQPGYEIAVRASLPAAAGTVPFVALQLQWSDPTTSLITARRDVVVAAGNGPGNTVLSFANGPARGGALKVTAVNLDPAATVTLDWTITQTSHVYEHDQAGQVAYPATAPHGFNNPTGVNGTQVIASVTESLSVGASVAFLCALYGGDVFVMIDGNGLTGPALVTITDPSGYATGVAGGELYGTKTTAGVTVPVAMTLPFSPVLLTISNTGTATLIGPPVTIVAQNH